MTNYALLLVIVIYLVLLFVIAFKAEKNAKSKWVNSPYIYVFALGVYCTAWTYYGSIGIASKSGMRFLAIYLGPVIAIPLWIVVLRKIIRISKRQKISSIADFISFRYGNSRPLGALVAITCLLGVIPYIALQLKAVSETFEIITQNVNSGSQELLYDSTLYISLLIAIFVAFFGTRSSDASEHKEGIMTVVALESVLKLLFFLVIGLYVCFYLFNGTTDIYAQASKMANYNSLTSFSLAENGFNWFFTICLSFFAIFLLPRQFHTAVVENKNDKNLKKAIWLFPLYLLLFNVFVIFIAWAGNLKLSPDVNHDYYSLLLPLQEGDVSIALIVFVGGFSAAISMIVVSTLALSTMLSNNIIIPYGFIKRMKTANPISNVKRIKNIRRIAIFTLIIFSYFFFIYFSKQLSLYSIGLLSFVFIAQLAPSFFLGLFWRRGTAKAAKISIVLGILVVLFMLVFPIAFSDFDKTVFPYAQGVSGNGWLSINQIFKLDYLSPESNAFLWSITLNFFCFISLSVSTKGNYRERNYAEMFVNYEYYENLQDSAFIWKGEAYVADIRKLLERFLGESKTERALSLFNRKYDISDATETADARLISFSEKLLTGSIGSASAKILLDSVTKEKPISLVEVLEILEEAKETKASNRALLEKSQELSVMTAQVKKANKELKEHDKLKDEFLDTVAHELKTPVTSIKAASELLEEEDMPSSMRKQFLENIGRDTDRLTVLINNILDLEKLSGNRANLDMKLNVLNKTINDAVKGISQIASKSNVQIRFEDEEIYKAIYDEDRILQVLTNLLSNSLKFTVPGRGQVLVSLDDWENDIAIIVQDNGRGIPLEDQKRIFEKFYQSKNQNTKKPSGSGFGLAICKKIIESHKGSIKVDENFTDGARFVFTIPKTK
ncbi:ATP-binding protein [Flavobacteriaceae bacterium M23B6Z8]